MNERHADSTPAGMSYHRDDPDMGDLPHRVPPDPDGRYTVDVHITPDGRARIGDHTYSPEEFADILRRNGDYDGRPIRLIGCDAGSNDFAKRLSSELGTSVLAPTKPAWTDPQGRVFSSDYEIGPDGKARPKIPPTGHWQTHHPDGTTTRTTHDGYTPNDGDHDKHGLNADDAVDRGEERSPASGGLEDSDKIEDEYRPPTAVERSENPVDPGKVDTTDPGPTPRTADSGPPDKSRGAVLDEFKEDDPRVTKRNKDGLIEEIDGKPVKQYVEELAKLRAERNIAPNTHRRNDGPCSAVAIDLRTGIVTEGSMAERRTCCRLSISIL